MFANKIKFKKNMYQGELLNEIKEYSEFLTEQDLPDPVINKDDVFTKIKQKKKVKQYLMYWKNMIKFKK